MNVEPGDNGIRVKLSKIFSPKVGCICQMGVEIRGKGSNEGMNAVVSGRNVSSGTRENVARDTEDTEPLKLGAGTPGTRE